jgi:uncharacterized protein YqhQ
MSSPKVGKAPAAYGGQAVIEGVMMRGPHYFAVACRKPDGEIVLREETVPAFFTRYAWARWPFIRGTFALADSLILGMKALMFSANLAMEEESKALETSAEREVVTETAEAAREIVGTRSSRAASTAGPITSIYISGSAVLGVALGIALFVLMPTIVVGLLKPWIPNGTILNICEGALRIGLFLGYIGAISRMQHVKRLFAYHGAEHKAINAFEEVGRPDVEASLRQSTIHPRCGTNFVLIVLMLKIVVAMFFEWYALWLRMAVRLGSLPVVAGLAYETIRLAGKYRHIRPLQWLVAPGLWTQRLTTREPSPDMVEVAVAALESVVRREQAAVTAEQPIAVEPALAAETV